jgi:hypothetical protein
MIITIAAGIVLAFILIALAGPIIALFSSLAFLLIIGGIFFGIIFIISYNIEFLMPFIFLAILAMIIIAIARALSKIDTRYTDVHVKVFFLYRFLRFTNQSKINYFKNLEIEKNIADKRIEQENQKELEYEKKRKLREQEAKYQKRVKQFSKITNNLKKLENKINTDNTFNFSYSEVSANIVLTHDIKPSKRAHSLIFGYDKKTNIDGYQFSVIGKGADFNGRYSGTKKEVLNWAIQELGKILAELEIIK